jgi:hypothetical protein
VEIPKGKSSVADIFVHLERVKEEFNISLGHSKLTLSRVAWDTVNLHYLE